MFRIPGNHAPGVFSSHARETTFCHSFHWPAELTIVNYSTVFICEFYMWICYLHICVLYLQRAELLPTSCYLHLNSLYSATSDYEWPRLWMFYKTRNICSLNEQCLARWARGIATTQAPQSGSQTVPLPDGGVKEVRHTPGPFQPSIMAWKGQAGSCFCSPLPYRRSSIVS